MIRATTNLPPLFASFLKGPYISLSQMRNPDWNSTGHILS
jgi:hypothetical protein